MLEKLLPRRRRRAKARTSEEVRLQSYPPPYPDGWYRLMNTDELGPGELRYIECLGRELVVWRSEDGASLHGVSVVDEHLREKSVEREEPVVVLDQDQLAVT